MKENEKDMTISGATKVEVMVGELDVISSGVVHILKDDVVKVKVANLTFALQFKSDSNGSRFHGDIRDGVMYIDFFNHNNSLGEGHFSPIEIANLNGRALSFSYCVFTLDANSGARQLSYAFYLG